MDVDEDAGLGPSTHQSYAGAQFRQPDGSTRMSGFGGVDYLAGGKARMTSDPPERPVQQERGDGRGGNIYTSGLNGGSTATPDATDSYRQPVRSWYDGLNLDFVDLDITRSAPFQLPKLDDDNYREWAQSIKWFMDSRQLGGIVDGSLPRPSEVTNRRQASVWDVYASYINNVFYGNASASQKAYIPISDNVTPKQIWDKWKEVHVVQSDHKIGDLIERLFTVKAKQEDGVDKVAAELSRINEQIYQIDPDEKFGDKAMGIAIIRAFSGQKKFEVLLTQLKVAEVISMTKVVSKLKTIEQYQSHQNYYARAAQDGANRYENYECHKCGELGHIARNCPNETADEGSRDGSNRKGAAEKGNSVKGDRSDRSKGGKDSGSGSGRKPKDGKHKHQKRGKHKAAVANEDLASGNESDSSDESARISVHVDEDFEEAAMARTDDSDDEVCSVIEDADELAWTTDSGASKHMTSDRRSFISWKNTTTGVKVGGNKTLQSPGRGDIEVLINGKHRVLRDVLYVPKLGYNLLSISALESSGFSVNFSKGKVEVKKNGASIAVGRRAKNLYHLSEIYADIALVSNQVPDQESSISEGASSTPEGASNEIVSIEDVDAVGEDSDDATRQPKNAATLFRILHDRLGHPGKG